MKGLIPDDKIEEIKRKADIVELVSEYVTLKKAGRNFLGLCPFHKEKTPSFTVNREKQMFHCFGCGEGGHVFSFLMKLNSMTFPEAARHLAKKWGIVIPEQAMTPGERMQQGLREQLQSINEAAAAWFVENLFSPAGLNAREYLKKRGISEEVVREFRLGYAGVGPRTLKSYFEQKKVRLEVACQAGLLIAKAEENGRGRRDIYDRFRGRLMFPIEDAAGQVIAFGGRIIDIGEPKYLNSPETPVFSKGRNLYGLPRAKEGIRKAGYAILVEGYFDLIALRNAGMTNALATLGTALTREQVDLLRRYTGQVVVLFDPDEAGKKALARSLPLFLSGGLQTRAGVLPENYDPDDFIRKFGRQSLEELIARAPSAVDYYIDSLVMGRDTLEEKRDAAQEALSFLASLDNAIERNLFLRRVSEKLGIDPEVLQREAGRKGVLTPASPPPASEKKGTPVDKVELSLIMLMLEQPESIAKVKEAKILDYFLNTDLKTLGEEILLSAANNPQGKIEVSFFLEGVETGPLKEQILRLLLEEKGDDETVMSRYVSDTIRRIKQKWVQKKSRDLNRELDQAQAKGDRDLCSRLLEEKDRLTKEGKMETS